VLVITAGATRLGIGRDQTGCATERNLGFKQRGALFFFFQTRITRITGRKEG